MFFVGIEAGVGSDGLVVDLHLLKPHRIEADLGRDEVGADELCRGHHLVGAVRRHAFAAKPAGDDDAVEPGLGRGPNRIIPGRLIGPEDFISFFIPYHDQLLVFRRGGMEVHRDDRALDFGAVIDERIVTSLLEKHEPCAQAARYRRRW